MQGVGPYRPPRPTIRELMEQRAAGTDDRRISSEGYPRSPRKLAYQEEDWMAAERRVWARMIQPW